MTVVSVPSRRHEPAGRRKHHRQVGRAEVPKVSRELGEDDTEVLGMNECLGVHVELSLPDVEYAIDEGTGDRADALLRRAEEGPQLLGEVRVNRA